MTTAPPSPVPAQTTKRLGEIEKELGSKVKVRETTPTVRKWIAYWLLGLLTAVVLTTLIWFTTEGGDESEVQNFLTLLEKVYAPLLTLVGTIIGFYFGGATKD